MLYVKSREGVGGSVRYCSTGGSAMGQDLLHWFRGIGVPVYEGYGLTEVAAAVTVDFDDQQIGTVGPPIGGMTVRTNGVGEILVKGPTVFAGISPTPLVRAVMPPMGGPTVPLCSSPKSTLTSDD